jgi:hypothetical protein
MWLGALLGNQFLGPLDSLDSIREEADEVTRSGFKVLVAGQHVIGDPYVMVDPSVSLSVVRTDLTKKYADVPDVVVILVAGVWRIEALHQLRSSLAAIGPGRVGLGMAAGYKTSDFPDEASHKARFRLRRERLSSLASSSFDWLGQKPIVWSAANTVRAAELANEFNAVCYVGPRVRVHDLLPMRDVLRDPGSIVIRRDVLLTSGPGLAKSTSEMASYAADKYSTLDQWGDSAADDAAAAKDESSALIMGSPEEVVAEINRFAGTCSPAGIVFRTAWPDMPRDVASAHVRAFCSAVVPGINTTPVA